MDEEIGSFAHAGRVLTANHHKTRQNISKYKRNECDSRDKADAAGSRAGGLLAKGTSGRSPTGGTYAAMWNPDAAGTQNG